MDSLTISQKLYALEIERATLSARWYASSFSDEAVYTDLGDVEGEMADLRWTAVHMTQLMGGEDVIG